MHKITRLLWMKFWSSVQTITRAEIKLSFISVTQCHVLFADLRYDITETFDMQKPSQRDQLSYPMFHDMFVIKFSSLLLRNGARLDFPLQIKRTMMCKANDIGLKAR